ncbi:MAG TPA: histidine triad nucleotide-binding protein [Micromonosporaceae bacterium]
MGSDCLFCAIVAGEIPSTVVYETDQVLAFRDINPQAPTHVVVIPKTHHDDAVSIAEADPALAAALVAAAGAVARQEGIDEPGYRLVFNNGPDAGQSVPHVHCHLLGGRPMAWPPG